LLSTPSKKKKASREAARARRKAEREAARGGSAPKRQEGWRETLRFWAWAILVILVLRAFFFEPFRIPTPSMENTLLVGDFLFVSKLHYGARTPNTVCVPFLGAPCLPGVELPQTRLPGFDDPDRGDVAVFNYPPETGPVERKTPYIKRLVGMPGDTLLVLDKVLYVNGERFALLPTQEQNWVVTPSENVGIPRARLDDVGAELLGTIPGTNRLVVNGPPAAAAAIRAWPYVASVEGYAIPEGRSTGAMFPARSAFNRNNYGPVVVPAAGQSVRLTPETWPLVEDVVTRFEGRRAEALPDGRFRIDGEPADAYTFRQDYYFGMGDNRDNSEDSRFWGFVPNDHLVGKAVLVFFSLDMEDRLLGLIPTPRLRGLQPIR
jgi:signal peptidase I